MTEQTGRKRSKGLVIDFPYDTQWHKPPGFGAVPGEEVDEEQPIDALHLQHPVTERAGRRPGGSLSGNPEENNGWTSKTCLREMIY